MTDTDRKHHWEHVYHTKTRERVSWFREHLEISIKLILGTGVGKDAAIIDVGGGNSTLTDDLLDLGFVDVSVLDISGRVIDDSRARLGTRAGRVNWIEADIAARSEPLRNLFIAIAKNIKGLICRWHNDAFPQQPDEKNFKIHLNVIGHLITSKSVKVSQITFHSEMGRRRLLAALSV